MARTTGLATNYTLSSLAVCDCTFTGPSYSTQSSASTLTGGLDSASGPSVANLTHPMYTTYGYDALNNLLTAAQGAMGPVGGQMLAPQNRTYAYDSLSRPTSASVPETNQAATTYTYTTFNAVHTRTDPRNIVSTYAYDTLNRLQTITYSDTTPMVTYTYGTTPASFNNGRILSYSDGTGTSGTGSTTFTYNVLGRVIKTGKAMGQVNYNIQYGYNSAGEVTRIIYPSGRTVNQTYDPIGRLQTIADATNNYLTLAPATDYTSGGQLKHFAYGNGVAADFGYNDHFETTSIRYSKSGSADLLNLAYNYGTQNDGEIATITDNLDATRSTSYTYDAWARLSTAQAGSNTSPTWKYSYDYDRFGNRLNQNFLAGTATGYNTLLTIDPNTNRITGTGNSYDAAGNMTSDGLHTYAFDAENRIRTVDSTAATYSYDATNLRAKKTVGGVTTLYLFSGQYLIAEYVGGAAASSPTTEYIGGGEGTLASISGGAVTYYQRDQLSPRVETNSAGAVTSTRGHFPFGEDWYGTGTADKWKFTTYQRDSESSLDYAINRYYSSRYGRFITTDPLGGTEDAPQSLNRYAYALGDPVDLTDPSGLRTIVWKDCTWLSSGVDGGGFTVCTIQTIEIPDSLGGDPGCPRNNPGCEGDPKQKKKPANNSIKQKICGAIPSGGTTGASGGFGGVVSPGGGGELVVNYDTGQVSAFAFGGVQLGWNGGVSGSVYNGFVWGLNGSNTNYKGGFTGLNGGAGLGGFAESSSGGLTGGTSGLAPDRKVNAGGISFGGGLFGGFSGGVTATNYSNPEQLGKFWAFGPGDWLLYAATQVCK